jgi:hypothetical protein
MVMAEEVGVVLRFLNPGCAIQEIWKSGPDEGNAARISHDSHRRQKKGCAKVELCVKSGRKGIKDKYFKRALPPQSRVWAEISGKGWFGKSAGIPFDNQRSTIVPFQFWSRVRACLGCGN